MWEQTDDNQYLKKDTENKNDFEVIEVTQFDSDVDKYHLSYHVVSLDNMTDKDMEYEIKGFYDSLNEIKEEYDSDWKQIVAEIVSENCIMDNMYFVGSKEDLTKELLRKYKITYSG